MNDEGPGPVDLLLRHGRIITLDQQRRILVDGAIAIAGGRIVAIGPDREVGEAAVARARETRDLRGALVHPGLVDAHVHTANEIARGFAPKTHMDMDPIDLAMFTSPRTRDIDRLGTLLSAMEMVANGTTAFSDTGSAFNLDAAAGSIEMVGLRAVTGHFLFGDADLGAASDVRGIGTEEADLLKRPFEECVGLLTDQLTRYPFRGPQRVRGAVVMYGSGRSSDELLQRGMELAGEHDAPMVIHQHWGPDEAESSRAMYGKAPIEHLADVGILGPRLTLVHMIHLTENEARLVVETDTRVVHCPGASMRRGMGAIRHGRFPELLGAGATVALGSDGYLNKRDLLRQAFLMMMGFREVRGEFPIVTGEQALEMATLHGARALGMEAEAGSLEAGKRADLVIHRIDRPEAHPRWQDPVDGLMFYRQTSTVDTVYVEGEAILDGGRFTRFDAEAAYREIDELAASVLEQPLGPGTFALWPLVP
ncbi:MAG: amidohydrolase family protein [Chloroflexi bacterium]|nr:amidohydrolase family protein [Chloroflexota bacterium]